MAGAVATADVAEFNARGFTIVPGVFQPHVMESLAATVSELAAAEVAAIVASGVIRDPDALGWLSLEDYSAWQRSNPDWQRTIVAMSKVQVMPGGEIVARKLNSPIKEFPTHAAFREIALSPKMLALASSLFGGRKALVYSDQVFIKPPEVGGPKPWVRVYHVLPLSTRVYACVRVRVVGGPALKLTARSALCAFDPQHQDNWYA